MPVLKFDSGGKNTGSSGGFCKYMEKEDKLKKKEKGLKPEKWLDQSNSKFRTHEVRHYIDKNKGQLGKKAGKYGTGSVNPTLKEWKSYGKTEPERKENFMKMVTQDVTDSITEGLGERTYQGEKVKVQRNDIHIFFKFEENRYYKGTDEEVKKGLVKSGQAKPGHQKHAHFILAFKTKDDKLKISTNDSTGKHFNRSNVKLDFEKRHDKTVGFKRAIKDTYKYHLTMKNGTAKEKIKITERAIEQELRHPIQPIKEPKEVEQIQPIETPEEKKNTLTKRRNLVKSILGNDDKPKPKFKHDLKSSFQHYLIVKDVADTAKPILNMQTFDEEIKPKKSNILDEILGPDRPRNKGFKRRI